MTAHAAEFGSPEYQAIVDLRRRVLRLPLGLDFTEEQLAAETEQTHLGLWRPYPGDGELVACALIEWKPDGIAKVRQVAVDPEAQGRGYGRQIMAACENEARERGARRVVLHAREGAVPFYLAIGYQIEGEPFEEIGIPHRFMARDLTGTAE